MQTEGISIEKISFQFNQGGVEFELHLDVHGKCYQKSYVKKFLM